jgi:hypothetical protein
MKFTAAFLIYFLTYLHGHAQLDSIAITYNKYVVTNENREVMLVYDEYWKGWELPGVNFDGNKKLSQVHTLMEKEYGIKTKNLKFRGLYSYNNPGKKRVLLKPYYSLQLDKIVSSSNLVQWVSLEKALSLIPYPTMRFVLEKIYTNPNMIYGAAFQEYDYSIGATTECKWKILEDFYELN